MKAGKYTYRIYLSPTLNILIQADGWRNSRDDLIEFLVGDDLTDDTRIEIICCVFSVKNILGFEYCGVTTEG